MLPTKDCTYSFERCFSRWLQQLQTDFCHFHHSYSDHSVSRRKPLTLLHVAVDVVIAAQRGRKQAVQPFRASQSAFYNARLSLLRWCGKTDGRQWSETFEMPTARRRLTAPNAGASNRSKRPFDSRRSLAACTIATEELNAPTRRDSISLHWLLPTARATNARDRLEILSASPRLLLPGCGNRQQGCSTDGSR